jgi:glycosyltransferase involved in cell wall biosynthesis
VRDEHATISAVMSVRDGERYLEQAIRSMLAQSRPVDEIIVVDDGSRDGTIRELERFGDAIRVLRQSPRGIAAGLNRGIAASRGDLLAFLDADDLWTTDAVARRLARLDRDDRPDGVYGRVEQFLDPDLDPQRFRFDPFPSVAPLLQALLIRRAAVDLVGPLDESFRTASNVDWLARAQEVGINLIAIPDMVGQRRIHGTNMGIQLGHSKRDDLLHVVRAHYRRGRDGSGSA